MKHDEDEEERKALPLSGRRDFLKSALITSAALALPVKARALDLPSSRKSILFLGGTNFIGPTIIEKSLKRGHEVTLFNRGKTHPELFPKLEKLRGNRFPEIDDGLKPLEGERKWDVVIDTCGHLPRIVKASVNLLRKRVEQYLYVSTAAVYAPGGNDEDHPLKQMPDETYEGDMPLAYALRKAACDRAVQQMLPGKATIIRPFVITGPRNPDHTYFTYWVVRAEQGGEILAPGNGTDLVQFIDVRDMADWIVGAIEQRHLGAYNMVGPRAKTTFAEYLRLCDEVTPGKANFTWVSEEFLAAQKMRDWGKIPMWMPGATKMSAAKAIATGLRYSELAYLIKDELQRYKREFPGFEFGSDGNTLNRKKELELLQAWHQEQRIRLLR